MSLWLIIACAILTVPLFAVYIWISSANRLAALEARCQVAYADIDVQLKRRADLVPGLVQCVRGFAEQEAKILGEVVAARKGAAEAAGAARDAAEAALGRQVGLVISLAEKYPDLTSSSHFRELRGELIDVEERLTAARRFFNLAVGEFNATLNQFPFTLIAARRRLDAQRPFDLGVERLLLDEAPAIRL